MPLVTDEVKFKQFHNILNEADKLRVTTAGMESKNGFLKIL